MISCREATEIISKSMDQPISLWTKIRLKYHLVICGFCQRFKDQLIGVRRALALSVKNLEQCDASELPRVGFKERLKVVLKSKDSRT